MASARPLACLRARPNPAIPCCSSRLLPLKAQPLSSRRALHRTASHPAPLTLSTPAASYPRNHTPLPTPVPTPAFLDNALTPSTSTTHIPLHDPATNALLTHVPQSTPAELAVALASSAHAFQSWRQTTWLHRQQLLFRLAALIREHMDVLAASITREQGKTFDDAMGDVLRGLQVAEACCGIPELAKGEALDVARDMETRTYREPLGVVAAICPFSA